MKESSKGEELAEAIFKENAVEDKQEERKQRCTYLLISWAIQGFCGLFVAVGLTWAVIQFMRLWGVLGVTSQEPPGLTYYIDAPDPPPPPRLL